MKGNQVKTGGNKTAPPKSGAVDNLPAVGADRICEIFG
jgi:hypothetical protein